MKITSILLLIGTVLACLVYQVQADTTLIIEFNNQDDRTLALYPVGDFIFQLLALDPDMTHEAVPNSTTSARFDFPSNPPKFSIEQIVGIREGVKKFEVIMADGQATLDSPDNPSITGAETKY